MGGTDLEVRPALPDFGLVFGFPNDVAIHAGSAFVNADGANAIYKFDLDDNTSLSQCEFESTEVCEERNE